MAPIIWPLSLKTNATNQEVFLISLDFSYCHHIIYLLWVLEFLSVKLLTSLMILWIKEKLPEATVGQRKWELPEVWKCPRSTQVSYTFENHLTGSICWVPSACWILVCVHGHASAPSHCHLRGFLEYLWFSVITVLAECGHVTSICIF